jgi:hypothetical protein
MNKKPRRSRTILMGKNYQIPTNAFSAMWGAPGQQRLHSVTGGEALTASLPFSKREDSLEIIQPKHTVESHCSQGGRPCSVPPAADWTEIAILLFAGLGVLGVMWLGGMQ